MLAFRFRVNASWFDAAQLRWHYDDHTGEHVPPLDITPANWSSLKASTWVHGLDPAFGWRNLSWADLSDGQP